MNQSPRTAILHYSAPPTIGGVEAVVFAHARVFLENGYPIKVIAGRGKKSALPEGADFTKISLLDSRDETVLEVQKELAEGSVSDAYRALRKKIKNQLEKALAGIDNIIAHNLFSKNYNLALSEALVLLHDQGKLPNLVAWCHDFSIQSKNDRPELHEGLPWDILRTYRPDIQYVTVSKQRQKILANIFDQSEERIKVVYNGFDPDELLGVSPETSRLISHLGLLDAEIVILMPVRITKAKNIEFALQVAAELSSFVSDCKIVLTGPPDPHDPENRAYFDDLRKMRSDLGVEENFKFIYEENPRSDEPYLLDMAVVADLYRVCDCIFMPSTHEGFGMPVLEAGFVGKPVFSSKIPASVEIGGEEIHRISLSKGAEHAAQQIVHWASGDPIQRLRQRTRQNHTWQKIFIHQIKPLLIGD